jgi:hypothetical protein
MSCPAWALDRPRLANPSKEALVARGRRDHRTSPEERQVRVGNRPWRVQQQPG